MESIGTTIEMLRTIFFTAAVPAVACSAAFPTNRSGFYDSDQAVGQREDGNEHFVAVQQNNLGRF